MACAMRKIITSLWYLLLIVLPIQTVYIFEQKMLGETTGGVWQYGVVGLYLSDVVAAVLLFFLIVSWFWCREWITLSWVRAGQVVLAGGMVQAALAVSQVLRGESFASTWLGMSYHAASVLGDSVVGVGDERWLRGYGMMPHPNILGCFLAMALIVNVVFFLWNRAKKAAWIYGGVVVILLAKLIATFSREAWVGAVAGFGVLCLSGWMLLKNEERSRWFRRLSVITLGLGVVCSVLLVAWWQPVSTRFGFHGWERLEQRSIDERVMSFGDGVSLWQDSPWFGHGVGRATVGQYEREKAQGRVHPTYWYQPPHNLYLTILVETGVAGFMVLFILMSEILLFSIRKMRDSASFGCFSKNVTIVSILAILLVTGLFDHFLWTLHAGVMLLLVFTAIFWADNE